MAGSDELDSHAARIELLLGTALVNRVQRDPDHAHQLETRAALVPGCTPERLVTHYMLTVAKRLYAMEDWEQLEQVIGHAMEHLGNCSSPRGELCFWLGISECLTWEGGPLLGLAGLRCVNAAIQGLPVEDRPQHQDLVDVAASLSRVALFSLTRSWRWYLGPSA